MQNVDYHENIPDDDRTTPNTLLQPSGNSAAQRQFSNASATERIYANCTGKALQDCHRPSNQWSRRNWKNLARFSTTSKSWL